MDFKSWLQEFLYIHLAGIFLEGNANSPPHHLAYVGETVSIRCKSTDAPVVWRKGQKRLDKRDKYLVLSDVQESDSGVYYCGNELEMKLLVGGN